MDFIFQGFQSTLPVWIYLLIFFGTLALSWWSYSISGISSTYRYLLITLRSSVFFILILLLINPFLKKEAIYYEPAEILVFLDDSESTKIEHGVYKGIKSYKSVLNQLNFADSSDVRYRFYSFSENVYPSHPDSLSFDGQKTNLSATVETIQSNTDEGVAALLISDGNYNTGKNPVYEAPNLDIPVFSIGLGDTTFQADLLVSSVSTSATGYLNSRQPIMATIQSKGFKEESFSVELRKDGEILSSRTITPQTSNSTLDVEFELLLVEEGLQQFEVVIPPLRKEWTDANNNQRFSIDVQDARQKVLSLALEIHPDVRFVRSLLMEDKNIELTNRTWLGGDRFIEGDFVMEPDSVDLAIIHGYPLSGLPNHLREQIKNIVETKPVISVATPQFHPQPFEQQIAPLPITITGPWNYRIVALQRVPEYGSHSIMELPPVSFERLSTLSAPIENLETTSVSSTLFTSTFQGERTGKPILTVQEIGNRRIANITAYNWFRLGQSSNPEERTFVRQLWYNIVSWTGTDPENQLLDIQPRKTSFTETEDVVINAYLKNERGEHEPDGRINITIASDSLENHTYSMENKGGGEYQLNLGTLPEDIYTFEAVAQKNDRVLDQKSGEFSVAESNIEFRDINRNERLLRQISEASGGTYVPFDSLSGFRDQLQDQGLLDPQKRKETTFFYPNQQIWWFVIVILLLCCEWILRKYFSLP